MIKDGKEFTKLQGIMGRYYALEAGESPEVADAIEEHLRPRFAEDRLPEGMLGTLVALADRLDTMAGCVLAGFAPTGSQDPYGLRRQALAVLRILVEHGWRLDLATCVREALQPYGRPDEEAVAAATIIQLFWGRLETLLGDLPPEIVRAVLSVHPLDPVENVRAARDLAALRGAESFGMLVEGARRCRNILVKAERLDEEGFEAQDRAEALQAEARRRWEVEDLSGWNPDDQAEDAEKALVGAAREALPALRAALESGAYTQAYESLSGLGPAIDRYFTDVLVNAEDPVLRRRRLDWLESLHYLFARFADLSRVPSA
jgi:glycyl-tRNA synthetase beta chain